MKTAPLPRTRQLTIIAQDPSVRIGGKILRAKVDVPAEEIAPGPRGYRVDVVDYDASTDTLYKPLKYPRMTMGPKDDPFEGVADEKLLADPRFHAQNVYAVVMRTIARFEYALGRHVSWGFYGHQIKVAPHAFADANAYYSDRDQALMFGYFPGRKGMVFTCLSHDVVAHETTHALLDGLRERYTDPSSPEQAAFHEGFADVVALLSVYALPAVVGAIIDLGTPKRRTKQIAASDVTPEKLRSSALFGLADEMGQELSAVRGQALRQSAKLKPSRRYIQEAKYEDPHDRGEIFVAAMMNAFVTVWARRLETLGKVSAGNLDRSRVVEEGASIADYLLTMAIRALDYAPPVNIEFCDYLSAILTSDLEINPNDARYAFRKTIRESFEAYGITPRTKGTDSATGTWTPPDSEKVNYDRTHFEAMQRDPDEVFRFIWENWKLLGLLDEAYTRVLSVRPCLRIGPDGFALRETVAEYMQILTVKASELRAFKIDAPKGLDRDQEVRLYGGGALIFSEYGRLKYHVDSGLRDTERQSQRLEYLWKYGYFRKGGAAAFRNFALMHRQRVTGGVTAASEEW